LARDGGPWSGAIIKACATVSRVVGGVDLAAVAQRVHIAVGPPLRALAEGALTGDAALPEYFDVFMEQLKTAKARVPHPQWGNMDGAISNAFQRILNGDQTVQAALDQAALEIDALLGN